jgi:predicted HicB family RNase H-like nuclease
MAKKETRGGLQGLRAQAGIGRDAILAKAGVNSAKGRGMKQMMVAVSPEEHTAVKIEAAKLGTTMQKVVQVAIQKSLGLQTK